MLNEQTLKEFISFLKKNQWQVVGPKNGQEFGDKIFIDELDDFDDLYLGPQLPFYSFKRFFVPEEERLFEYKGAELEIPPSLPLKREERIAIVGMNLLDLKSVLLYDQVFEKDPYYQARRQNTLVVGHSIIPSQDQNIFEQVFEEDTLEHLSFDIFLGALKENPSTRPANAGTRSGNNSGNLLPEQAPRLRGASKAEYAVFTGSLKGQKVLEDFGYNDYINIQFSGPVKEGKLDERMLRIQDKLKNKHNQKIWDELGKRCIECGKCTVSCPTCFCFRIDDFNPLPSSPFKRGRSGIGQRQRCWDSCYYQEFSEVAGGHKFLSNTAARIHFWYYHKFGRIPEEFNFMGCVGCHRCAAVCPVGIDISEVLKSIENS